MKKSRIRVWATTAMVAGVAVMALGASAVAQSPAESAGAPVSIDWWHITTGDPGKTDFQNIANAYMAAHPNVTINITVLENEAFKSKLATTMQGNDIPDLFQSWGGGTMAAKADAGKLQDITDAIAPWKTRSIPVP